VTQLEIWAAKINAIQTVCPVEAQPSSALDHLADTVHEQRNAESGDDRIQADDELEDAHTRCHSRCGAARTSREVRGRFFQTVPNGGFMACTR
jgi:hypothetical protein